MQQEQIKDESSASCGGTRLKRKQTKIIFAIYALVVFFFVKQQSLLFNLEYRDFTKDHHYIPDIYPFSLEDKHASDEKLLHTSLSARTEELLSTIAGELKGSSSRFYMHDHPNITLVGEKEKLDHKRSFIWKAHQQELENDEQMLAALKKSPLRTDNPDEADLFIPPIPIARILGSKEGDFQTPMETLLEEETFRKHQGHKHVLISTCFALFKMEHKHRSNLGRWYDLIYNVTVVQSWDPSAVYNELHHTGGGADWGDFSILKDRHEPLTRRSSSVGLGMKNEDLELTIASTDKFYKSSNLIFYQSRTEPSYYNSTIHRHAPITNITLETFPKSSIGWGLEKDEWQRELKDSKFCLVIRGDSPHSHALWRSIRVGCIPVISADVLPIFAPMFKSTLNMTDYAIVLREQELVNNPGKTLLQLDRISEEDIEVKIKHLVFAQRVIFTDHPQSLFVPALLKEAKMATEVQLL